MTPEEKLIELELGLPKPLVMPVGATLPFPWVKLVDKTLHISGHLAQKTDGTIAGPFGSVGVDVSIEEAQKSAKQVGLTMLSNVKRELGDLSKIRQWTRAFGMVNTAPGFKDHPIIINGFTNLVIEIFDENIGSHARSAVGMSSLPFNVCVKIEAELIIH
jgi:hypothetical protein